MAICPVLTFALVIQKYESVPLSKATEENSGYIGIDCMRSGCQMWNTKGEDCGLKRPNDLTSSQSVKDEHKEEEKQFLTPGERDPIHLPFPEDAVKYNQDPWTCPE